MELRDLAQTCTTGFDKGCSSAFHCSELPRVKWSLQSQATEQRHLQLNGQLTTTMSKPVTQASTATCPVNLPTTLANLPPDVIIKNVWHCLSGGSRSALRVTCKDMQALVNSEYMQHVTVQVVQEYLDFLLSKRANIVDRFKRLQQLNLELQEPDICRLSSEGQAAFVGMLGICTSLVALTLSSAAPNSWEQAARWTISTSIVATLATSLPKLQRLDLLGCNSIMDAAFACLSACTALTHLGMTAHDGISGRSAPAALSAACIESIGTLALLQSLTMEDFCPQGSISSLSNLTCLSILSWSPHYLAKRVAPLAHLLNSASFRVSLVELESWFGLKDTPATAAMLAQLDNLRVLKAYGLTWRRWEFIEPLTKLQQFTCSSCEVGNMDSDSVSESFHSSDYEDGYYAEDDITLTLTGASQVCCLLQPHLSVCTLCICEPLQLQLVANLLPWLPALQELEITAKIAFRSEVNMAEADMPVKRDSRGFGTGAACSEVAAVQELANKASLTSIMMHLVKSEAAEHPIYSDDVLDILQPLGNKMKELNFSLHGQDNSFEPADVPKLAHRIPSSFHTIVSLSMGPCKWQGLASLTELLDLTSLQALSIQLADDTYGACHTVEEQVQVLEHLACELANAGVTATFCCVCPLVIASLLAKSEVASWADLVTFCS